MSSNELTNSRPVVALAADMIFGAKIRGTGQSVSVPVVLARNAAHLLEITTPDLLPRLIILDLDTRGLDIPATIQSLKSNLPQIPILAFVSHVNTTAIKSARDAGADKVLARSAFSALLPEILTNA